MLTACTSQLAKEEQSSKADIFEIERLAAEAYEKNQWVESEQHYSELVKRIPERALHWFRLGNVYARTQRPDAAIIAYREALLRDPKMAKAWYNMGVLQLRQAANSFNEFQIYVDTNDPLYNKGQTIFTGIVDLIQGDDE